MKELIADLRNIESTDNPDGDELADHGIVQEIEGMLLDNAGKVIRIRITEVKVKHEITTTKDDKRLARGRRWFEYHCYEGEDSSDAELWHHTHQQE